MSSSPTKNPRVREKTVVVTGAASGIGRALAVELAARGARVAISDVDAAGLNKTRLALEGATDDRHHSAVVDVSDRGQVLAYANTVMEHFGVAHQIYNNAGVGISGSILETDFELWDKVLGVNLWGVVHGTKAFLPHLIASGDGHVVNISSLNGYMAWPRGGMYATSKFAVRGFTESLRCDMLAGDLPVAVSCVHPGGVRTEIATNALRDAEALGVPVSDEDRERSSAFAKRLLKMDPARAAKIIVDGVEAGKPRIRVGRDARFVDRLVRLMPVHYQKLGVDMFRRSEQKSQLRTQE